MAPGSIIEITEYTTEVFKYIQFNNIAQLQELLNKEQENIDLI